MITLTVEVENIEKFMYSIDKKLDLLVYKLSLLIEDRVSVYPPETEANNPANQKWYERGYGFKWKTASGVQGRRTSEKLGDNWKHKSAGFATDEIYTNVSYAPYVHGPRKQTKKHKNTGWLTTKQIIDDVITEKEIERIIEQWW